MAFVLPDEDGTEIGPQVVGVSNPCNTFEGLRMRTGSPEIADDSEPFVRQELPTQAERRWSLILTLGSVADIVISGVIVAVALRFAVLSNGASLYCLAMQSGSHLLSSLLLALRFFGEYSLMEGPERATEGLLRRKRLRFLLREQGFSVAMGIAILLSSAGLLFKAVQKINMWDQWYLDHSDMDAQAAWANEFLAWYGFAVYLLQAIFRFVAARYLRRSIIWHAITNSVVSLFFLFVLGFSASYQKEWSWKAEPIAAILLCLANLIEGVRIIILNLDDMETRLRFDSRA